MKNNLTPKLYLLVFSLALLSFAAKADTLNNDFSTPFDYIANGIIGDTNWDGVYFRFGDIPNGSPGGFGNGVQNVATTISPFGGFLNLQNTGGDWSGADDDGFFLYKVVTGDFDVSVQSVPGTLSGGTGYDARGNNFAGLQVRAYHTNNSGAAYSTTLTNDAENSVRLWRFNQFNIDGQIRRSTNGADFQNTYIADQGTNTTRFYRIVRQNDTNLYFYWKINSGDPWLQITNGATPNGVMVRSDWAGVKVQVGIAQAAFATASRDAIFDDFSLTGPNVTFPVMPPAPANLVTTATNTGGSLSLAWSTNGGDGSLVVMSRRPIQHNPVQGIVYNASPSYGNASSRLGEADEYVVYSGPNTSVTVTNLGANNTVYYVGVYSYVNPTPVYNTASPATNAFPGPGVIVSAAISAPTNNIPLGGAVKLSLIASFSTGETSDQSVATTWSSDNATVANVNGAGVVSGLANGTATITATFGPYSPTAGITVHSPVFTDTFTSTNDYIAGGLIGTPYDGLFLKFGDVPGAVAGADGAGSTLNFDSQISSANGLFVSSVQSTWQGTGDDGPFLYKIVPGSANAVSGDFQALVHINAMNNLNGAVAGIMARLYNPLNHGPGPNAAENHVNYWKVQNGTTSVRRIQAGGTTTFVAAGPAGADGWMLIQRASSTNFYFFEKATTSDLWTFVTNIVLVTATNNAPMEVGVAQQSTAGVNATTTFDSFMLDAPGIVTTNVVPAPATNMVMTLNGNLSITISYTTSTNPVDGGFYRSIVVMRDGAPVSAQPYTGMPLGGNSLFGDANNSLGDGNYVVYRSPSPTTTSNQSVTVTGLTPGHTYYAAVYTFVSLGTTRTFNNNATTANSLLQDGVLQFLEVLPTPSIPRGGIGFMQVIGHYTGGAVLNVSPFATITSDNTNVIKVQTGILTGISNGVANITLVFSGVTNTAAVTVRGPSLADNFSTSQDYLLNGVAGSIYQGMYNINSVSNPIPDSTYVPLAGSGATVANANINSNNILTITSAGDGWENGAAGGFYLFRYVPGDFQMAIHVQAYDIAAFNQPGLMARAYAADTNGNIGAPFGTIVPNANGTNDSGEYWVSFVRFDEFNIGTYARRNIDSAVSQNTQPDPGPVDPGGAPGTDTNLWLLIVRSGGSEFDFYKRATINDAWKQVPNKTHYSLAQFAGQPMQVGPVAGPFTGGGGTLRTVQFDNFMLDSTSGSPLRISQSGGNVTVSWPAIPGTLQSSSTLVPPNWQPVSGTPTLGPTGYSLTLPVGPGPLYFRLAQ